VARTNAALRRIAVLGMRFWWEVQMNGLVTGFRFFVAAIVVAAFASGVNAGNTPAKIYSINVTTLGVAPVGITIKNETPSGNSTINSFTITPPAGVTVSLANPASSDPATVTQDPNTGIISVNGFTGLKSGTQTPKAITIYVNATVANGVTCGASYQWTAQTWTGNAANGDQFGLVVGSPPTNQGLQTATCSLRYVPAAGGNPLRAPRDALVNTPITSTDNNAAPTNLPVQVEAVTTGGTRVTTFSGTVTLVATSGPAGSVTGNTAAASNGVATFPNFSIGTEGIYQFKATSPGQTDSAPSAPFTIGDGVLNCGQDMPLANTNPNNLPEFDGNGLPVPGWAGAGKRGPFNKDGSPCVLVNYTFANTILTNNTVVLHWATDTQPGAAFTYTVNWKPEYVGAGGVPVRVTMVQWFDQFGNPVPATPVPAHGCLSPDLPAPYGTLAGNIGAADLTITIDTTSGVATLPATPFPLSIANERLTAIALTGTSGTLKTYTVTRGGTNGTTAAAHNVGDKTMSNPLPLDANGVQMRACIADEGYAIVPPGAPDCPTSGPGAPAIPTACAVVTTTLHDLGDAFMTRD
jgi:hypothetical protein